jgi:hypothetical protein
MDWKDFKKYFEQHHDDLQQDFSKVVGTVNKIEHLSTLLEKKATIPGNTF